MKSTRLILIFMLLAQLGSFVQLVSAGNNTILSATGVTVVLDFGNETRQVHENAEGLNVLEATLLVTNIEYEWYGDLVFITAIADVPNDPTTGQWWQYWVNGVLGPVAANKYLLQNNDTIEWRLSAAETKPGTELHNWLLEDPSLVAGIPIVALLGGLFLVGLRIRVGRND